MANSILSQSGQLSSNDANLLQQFNAFKQTFKGDPQQMVMQMVQSGKVSRQQLQEAIKIANKFSAFIR